MPDVLISRISYRSRSGNVNEMEESGICHAYGALYHAGINTEVQDFYLNHNLTIDDVLRSDAKILLFYVRWPGEFWAENQKFIKEIREKDKYKDRVIAVFGETAVGQEKALKETPINVVITGEELEIVDYCKAILNNDNWKECSGIAYLNEEQLPIFNRGRELVHNLDELPKAKHYWLEYCKEQGISLDFTKAAIRTSRGCYARCKFCYITGYDNLYENYTWRSRSTENIFNEIKEIVKEFGITEFIFSDATFFNRSKQSKDRAIELSKLIKQSGLDISFLIYTRANDVDKETFKIMKEAGLYAVLMGLESFVPAKMRRYSKGNTVEQNYNALKVFKELDLYMNLGFILFDKDTTLSELREDLKGLKWLVNDKSELITDPTTLVGSVFIPYEGSRVEAEYFNYKEEQFLFSAINDRLGQLDSMKKYGFKDAYVAALADAGWLFGREVGSQQYHKRKLQGEMISRLLEDENDDEAMNAVEKLLAWRNKLAKFAVYTFADIVEEVAKSEDPVNERFHALDRAFEKFKNYNRKYLGDHNTEMRWIDEYQKLREKELALL
ncbi:B12-binding domain-containing radical SAM protein [Bacillus sp. S10(2024)]|uniref:B12-binding domain-containing radical SAM protein n=1 Tax=Bacillus sp. S10(2024) TaxID=3162886 RepID=UPI003D23214E